MHTDSRDRVAIPLLLLSLALGSTVLLAQPSSLPPDLLTPDRVLVAFRPGVAASDIRAAHARAEGRSVKSIPALGIEVVEVPRGAVRQAIEVYERDRNVRFAEPDYRRLLFLPVTIEGSEPTLGIANNFDEQYGLHNTGQAFGVTVDPLFGTVTAPAFAGTPDADIDAPEGWAVTHGSASIKIAIIDSGISCAHVDLDAKCVEQINFVDEHGSPIDDLIGHGTHVAAIAAAETDNGKGTAGVAWEASVGALKACWEDTSLAVLGIILGVCDDADVADAITYAADNGYQVINMSLAGPEFSQTLQSAVDYAWAQGVVLVGGAGNEYTTTRQYPAAYANVIGVAATDYFDNLASFSSFSEDADDWVSVAAPGHTIFAAVPSDLCGLAPDDPEGCYDWKSGTSMSTPVVAGIAAMLWSHLPSPTNADVRSAIENGADPTGALGQNILAWTEHGRANLHQALTGEGGNEPPPPPPPGDTTAPVITNVVSTDLNGPNFEISWTTDEPSTSVVTLTCCGVISDAALVTSHSLSFRGKNGQSYEFTVQSVDASGNQATAGPFFHQN